MWQAITSSLRWLYDAWVCRRCRSVKTSTTWKRTARLDARCGNLQVAARAVSDWEKLMWRAEVE